MVTDIVGGEIQDNKSNYMNDNLHILQELTSSGIDVTVIIDEVSMMCVTDQ